MNEKYVLSLPMRNWNIDEQTGEVLIDYGFESTYEELKHKMNIDLTGNERLVLSLPMRNWNPKKAKYTKADYKVLSLPMRNWNT